MCIFKIEPDISLNYKDCNQPIGHKQPTSHLLTKLECVSESFRNDKLMWSNAYTTFAKNFSKTHIEIAACCNSKWSANGLRNIEFREFYLRNNGIKSFRSWLWNEIKNNTNIKGILQDACKWLLNGKSIWLICSCEDSERESLNSTCNSTIIRSAINWLITQPTTPKIRKERSDKGTNKPQKIVTSHGISQSPTEWAESLDTTISNISHRLERKGSPFLSEPTPEEIERIKNRSNRLLKTTRKKKIR